MKFKITTQPWKWADAVRDKHIYRDEEFIVTDCRDEALESAEFLLQKSPACLTYTITVYRDNNYYTYFRHSMPCMGGLAKYCDTHGAEKHYYNPYFPRDIKVSFPEGEIIYIGYYLKNVRKNIETKYCDFVLSQESPWVSAFNSRESIIVRDNYIILTDMDTNPTMFYSLLKYACLGSDIYGSGVPGWNPKASILLYKTTRGDPRRLAGQKPNKNCPGTWAEGYGYGRCFNESIFATNLPCEMKDFAKFTYGYPRADYNNNYFLEIMKNEFGITSLTKDQYTHDALVEAWDYFKKESLKL